MDNTVYEMANVEKCVPMQNVMHAQYNVKLINVRAGNIF